MMSSTPVIDFFPTGLLVTSYDLSEKKRLVTYANSFFIDSFGFSEQALKGCLLADLFTKASIIALDTYVVPMLIHEHQVTEIMLDIESPQGRIPVIVNARLHGENEIYWSISDAFKRDELYEELLKARDQLEENAQQLHIQSFTDDLTGLQNRRALESEAKRLLAHHQRTGRTMTLCMMDIDDFKRINDTQGHAVGDEVLIKIGVLLRSVTRDSDVVARYGGEEFVLLMPETTADEATHLTERIHLAMTELPGDQPTTLSIGVVENEPDTETSLRTLFQRADKALYQAKKRGKNQTVRFSDT